MPDLERPRLALYVALGLAVCLLGARYVLVQAPSGREDGGAVTAVDGGGAAGNGGPGDGGGGGVSGIRVERGGRVTVHVAGAVRKPGVYRMGPGARVDDALRRAGGARRGADLTAVNLAATLEDGRQVLVPERVSPPASTAGAGAAAAPGGGAAAPAAGAAAPINLNTATLEQLDTLDGVGPGIAQRILDYREQHGAFERVEELGEVPGIGAKRLATLTPLVTV